MLEHPERRPSRSDETQSKGARSVTLAASVACANFLRLEDDLAALEAAGVDYLHIDIMDGQFVPNFSLNTDIMKAARQVTSLPMDVHLMVERPERYIEPFIAAGGSIIAVHQECVTHLQRTLAEIQRAGAQAGVALNPATPLQTIEYVMENVDFLLLMTVNPGFYGQKLVPSALRKIADARALCLRHGRDIPICVDGNVSLENAPKMVAAGADFLVGGTSSVFMRGATIAEGAQRLREAVAQAAAG
jgi:ribulose-phosphate 3-epimerase